jgi:hypothetical protein
VAFAWNSDTPFRVKVHGHLFDRAVLTSDQCVIQLALYFSAPSESYSNSEEKQNHYRFRARVKFDSGQQRITPIFINHGSGLRVYKTQFDTAPDGCWARTEQKLEAVDVEGCRRRKCIPDPFE